MTKEELQEQLKAMASVGLDDHASGTVADRVITTIERLRMEKAVALKKLVDIRNYMLRKIAE